MQIQKFDEQHDNDIFDLTVYPYQDPTVPYHGMRNISYDYNLNLTNKTDGNVPLYSDNITGEISRIGRQKTPIDTMNPHCPICHSPINPYSTSENTIYQCSNLSCQLNKCCFTKQQIESNPAFRNNLLFAHN